MSPGISCRLNRLKFRTSVKFFWAKLFKVSSRNLSKFNVTVRQLLQQKKEEKKENMERDQNNNLRIWRLNLFSFLLSMFQPKDWNSTWTHRLQMDLSRFWDLRLVFRRLRRLLAHRWWPRRSSPRPFSRRCDARGLWRPPSATSSCDAGASRSRLTGVFSQQSAGESTNQPLFFDRSWQTWRFKTVPYLTLSWIGSSPKGWSKFFKSLVCLTIWGTWSDRVIFDQSHLLLPS